MGKMSVLQLVCRSIVSPLLQTDLSEPESQEVCMVSTRIRLESSRSVANLQLAAAENMRYRCDILSLHWKVSAAVADAVAAQLLHLLLQQYWSLMAELKELDGCAL